ncbi:16S rRNA (guanine(527)-N(7))-methyltransferase RsmG [Candidatus Peregrinibacteria bacterium]|jgi:16S rRNA (guanine527-N7)-methyltransferase|nr:16S rRNA (guanine(527)-N(7))-methyltransferase RsmG [Candidatus Peregrinibacteria bacterium]
MNKEKFLQFIESLFEVNQKINLISRETKKEDFFNKHIFDSVKILEYLDFSNVGTLLDIGSGGGIPGIPLAIELPNATVTLLDSTEKKMKAAKEILKEIGVENVKTAVGRIEELGHDPNFRESFDVVTARAVAPLPTLLEYALPFVKVGGHFIAYKSKNYSEELAICDEALKLLGGKLIATHEYTLPADSGERVYLVFEKIKETPEKYPRRIGVPKKSPLI